MDYKKIFYTNPDELKYLCISNFTQNLSKNNIFIKKLCEIYEKNKDQYVNSHIKELEKLKNKIIFKNAFNVVKNKKFPKLYLYMIIDYIYKFNFNSNKLNNEMFNYCKKFIEIILSHFKFKDIQELLLKTCDTRKIELLDLFIKYQKKIIDFKYNLKKPSKRYPNGLCFNDGYFIYCAQFTNIKVCEWLLKHYNVSNDEIISGYFWSHYGNNYDDYDDLYDNESNENASVVINEDANDTSNDDANDASNNDANDASINNWLKKKYDFLNYDMLVI